MRTLAILVAAFAAATFARQIQFYDPEIGYGVALTTVFLDNGTQILMQLSAPTSYGWAAFGTGSMMDESTMFIIYPSSDNSEVIFSIRSTSRNDAPREIGPNKVHARVRSSTIKDGRMTANIVWQEQTTILADVVDPGAHAQGFIWAVGPSIAIRSDDTNAPIAKHEDNGVLFANMPDSQTPQEEIKPPEIQGTSTNGFESQPEYYHTLVYLHVGLLACSFFVIYPLGVVLLRLNPKNFGFKIHWVFQSFASFAVVSGLVVAVTMSILGKRYKHFTEPHQMVGIGIVCLVIFQVWLGRAHHIRFRIYKKRTPFTYAHMVFGRLVIYGGMANACLGMLLCGRRIPVYVVGGVAGIVLVIVEAVAIGAQLRRRHHDQRSERIKGYNSSYHKLKDVTVTEHEFDAGRDIPMQRYPGYGYSQKL